MQVVRTDQEIARVENWALEWAGRGSRYPGTPYEQGILDMLQWLNGELDIAPDDE